MVLPYKRNFFFLFSPCSYFGGGLKVYDISQSLPFYVCTLLFNLF